MRLDLFLKLSRLVKRRSLAQEICRAGRVRVRASRAKPGQDVKVGDRIEIEFPSRILELEVLEIPQGRQVDKKRARDLYAVLAERGIDPLLDDPSPSR